MAVIIEINNMTMRFGYSPEDQTNIKNWETAVEERIFMEQIKPGSKLSRQMPDIVAGMKERVEREDIKEPYGGTFGNAKAVEFGFKGTMVYVKSASFQDDPFEIVNENGHINDFVNDESLYYEIGSEDLQSLNTWRNTEEGKGEISDYSFTFWENSIGDGLFIINKQTGAKLDLSKYENF